MKTSTIVVLVLVGCGGLLVVMIAICAGAFFFLQRSTNATVSPKVDALFARIDSGTFDDAYMTETTREFRAVLSKEKWQEIGLLVKTRLGRLQSKSMTRFSAKQFNATTAIDAAYDASFQKGPGTISVEYTGTGSHLLLNALYVTSPLLDVGMLQKCPHCGELTPASAKFCANCGKPLKDAKPAARPVKSK